MPNKFSNVPVEGDTEIIFQQEATLGDYNVLYQKWVWDGIAAESLIFISGDVADLTDEQLEREARSSPLVQEGSSVTIKRSDTGYTFFNFNFEVL